MKRGFVDTVDGQLHYFTAGAGSPLVMLHLTPDPRSYLPAFPYLSKAYQLFSIDTPGYGDSERPPVPYTTIDQFATAIVRAIDGLGLKRFTLLGHMTGANLAAEVASMIPDRIDKLVLSELFDWQSHEEFVGAHGRRFPSPDPEPDGSHLIKIWNQYSGMLGEVSMEDVQRRFFVLFQALYKGPRAGGEIYGNAGWAAAAPHTIEHQQLVKRLPMLTMPTLIMCAGLGVLRSGGDPKLDRDRLVSLLPNGVAKTVPDITHVAPFTQPERFAEEVLAFLQG